MSRVDQYQIHLTVSGRDCGNWITHAGGGVDSEESFVREEYDLPRVALGGSQTIKNVTLERMFTTGPVGAFANGRDLIAYLRGQAGKGRAAISKQLLDADGFAIGTPEVRSGVLKTVDPPDADIEGSDVGKMSVEISTDGVTS